MEKELMEYSDEELLKELKKRKVSFGTCTTCRHWETYMGCSDSWRESMHCHGCRKRVELCTCR